MDYPSDCLHELDRVMEVKAYVSYHGPRSEKLPNVQFHQVKRIVTTEDYWKNKGQKSFDGSCMQVDRPFSGNDKLTSFTETAIQETRPLPLWAVLEISTIQILKNTEHTF